MLSPFPLLPTFDVSRLFSPTQAWLLLVNSPSWNPVSSSPHAPSPSSPHPVAIPTPYHLARIHTYAASKDLPSAFRCVVDLEQSVLEQVQAAAGKRTGTQTGTQAGAAEKSSSSRKGEVEPPSVVDATPSTEGDKQEQQSGEGQGHDSGVQPSSNSSPPPSPPVVFEELNPLTSLHPLSVALSSSVDGLDNVSAFASK